MRKEIQGVALLTLLALLLLACGGDGDAEEGDEIEGMAWLRVGAQLVHGGPLGDPEGVAAIRAELREAETKVVLARFDLQRLMDPFLWEAVQPLPPGAYELFVRLYGYEAGEPGDEAGEGGLRKASEEPAYTSRVLTRELREGRLDGLIFLLDPRSLQADGSDPYFEAIGMAPLVVEPQQDVKIQVLTKGGSGALRLELADAEGNFLADALVLDERGGGELTLQAPPVAGLQALVFRVVDDQDQVSEMGASYMTGDDDRAFFPMTWNRAPVISVQNHVRYDDEGPELRMLLRATDDRSPQLSYRWGGSCTFEFEEEAGGPAEGLYVEKGAGGERGMPFLARLGALGTEGCQMTVTVTDDEGASTLSEINVDAPKVGAEDIQ